MRKARIVLKKAPLIQPFLKIKTQRYLTTTTLIPSMYGGVLTIENGGDQPGLGLSLPGDYVLEQLDEQTVAGQLIVFSGCEDERFTFHFVYRFETPITAIDGALTGKRSLRRSPL